MLRLIVTKALLAALQYGRPQLESSKLHFSAVVDVGIEMLRRAEFIMEVQFLSGCLTTETRQSTPSLCLFGSSKLVCFQCQYCGILTVEQSSFLHSLGCTWLTSRVMNTHYLQSDEKRGTILHSNLTFSPFSGCLAGEKLSVMKTPSQLMVIFYFHDYLHCRFSSKASTLPMSMYGSK